MRARVYYTLFVGYFVFLTCSFLSFPVPPPNLTRARAAADRKGGGFCASEIHIHPAAHMAARCRVRRRKRARAYYPSWDCHTYDSSATPVTRSTRRAAASVAPASFSMAIATICAVSSSTLRRSVGSPRSISATTDHKGGIAVDDVEPLHPPPNSAMAQRHTAMPAS